MTTATAKPTQSEALRAAWLPYTTEVLADGARLLRGFALTTEDALLSDLPQLLASAPLRHMYTPGGRRIRIAMSNCGALGWISDRHGYRYQAFDPLSGQPWPAMPASFRQLAQQAAKAAGYGAFQPDACLINCYTPGTQLSLHQDRDEHDFNAPIVSVSLGLSVIFLFGGQTRHMTQRRILLEHGDVVVWGGPSRLNFHGVMPLKPGHHPRVGKQRYNLTFRQAGSIKVPAAAPSSAAAKAFFPVGSI